jgi:hypothetical protein
MNANSLHCVLFVYEYLQCFLYSRHQELIDRALSTGSIEDIHKQIKHNEVSLHSYWLCRDYFFTGFNQGYMMGMEKVMKKKK